VFKAFEASSANVEVDIRTSGAIVNGMLIAGLAREFLAAENLRTDDPNIWVPWQKWLDAYRRIQESLGEDTLYSIGRRVPYSADFPDESMFDVPSALAAIDVAYQRSHRGGEIGEYRYVEAGPGHYQIHCDNPYPNMFDLGIVASLVERFRGKCHFKVALTARGPGKLWDNACVLDVRQVL
jgi:hypothetical protein